MLIRIVKRNNGAKLSIQLLKSGYIEFAPLEYYADAIHSATVNPAS